MSDSGNLYGTTRIGGGYPNACQDGCGTIWKLTNSNGVWEKSTLHRFKGPDGVHPTGRLIRDKSGNLYGTTQQGGGSPNCLRGGGYNDNGCGTVFKRKYTGELTVLNNFDVKGNGRIPYAGVVRDSLGNLYGTTLTGGDSTNCIGGCGTVFKIEPSGKKTVLHRFTGGSDGANPFAELLLDETTHTLYGTAYDGGSGNETCFGFYAGRRGCGVVFKIEY